MPERGLLPYVAASGDQACAYIKTSSVSAPEFEMKKKENNSIFDQDKRGGNGSDVSVWNQY